MTTKYHSHGVKLSQGQLTKLARAYSTKSPITLRLSRDELSGSDELMLTKTQLKKIQKAMKNGVGVDIKISKAQIQNAVRHGGSLWSTLAGLSSRVLPMVMPLAKKVASPLFSGAVSGLASLGIDKLFGGAVMIPSSKVNKLIPYKDHLTATQKKNILQALQTGSGMHFKPTQKQIGSGIWSILASIGIPMVLNALTGKGLQVDPFDVSRTSIYVPRRRGKGLQVDPPPPFYGTWENPIGMGLKPKKKTSNKKKKGSGLLLGKNSPFNSIPILGALL